MVCLILLTAIILRIIHGSWLAPSAFYSLWWGSTTLISVLIGSKENVPNVGLIWILSSCILIGLGSLIFIAPKLTTFNLESQNYDNLYLANRSLRVVYFFSVLFSFCYIISFIIYNQVSIQDFKSLEGLLILSAKFSKDRYEENVTLPMFIKLQLPFVFFSNALGGALFSISRKKKYFLALLPSVIISILFTEKAGIFFCLSIWISAYLSLTVALNNLKFFNYQIILRLFMSGVILLSILITSAFARLGTVDMGEFEVVLDKLYSTLFGHIAAFSNWLQSFDFINSSLSFGRFTLAGVFDFFGISKRDIGLYTVNYKLSSGEMTNLYSIHKGLILDFSAFGSLIIYFIYGMIGSFLFAGSIKGKRIYIGFLSIIYLITFVSIFYSIFIFNTTLLSCFMTVFVFLKLKLIQVKRN